MPATPIRLVAALFFLAPLVGACSTNFDPTEWTDKLDFFHLNDEKKLKGERKPLFPEGVPGVSQGIPPDLVKGYKPPEVAAVPEEPPPEEKPKPKPRVVHRAPPKQQPPKQQPAQQQQAPQQQPQQAQQQSPWPQQTQQTQRTQQSGGTQSPWSDPPKQQTSPWPDAPAPNTFQR